MISIVRNKRSSEANHIYYEKNKERINKKNVENHRKPEIVEYIKKYHQRPCTCLVCNQNITYDAFRVHTKTKKHARNYLNYDISQPIMVIQS